MQINIENRETAVRRLPQIGYLGRGVEPAVRRRPADWPVVPGLTAKSGFGGSKAAKQVGASLVYPNQTHKNGLIER